MTTEPVHCPGDAKLLTSYTELIAEIREQVGRLGVRYEDFDVLAGFPAGLTGKALGPAQVKRLGPEKLFDAIRAAGGRLRFEVDPEQFERMKGTIARKLMQPRQANQARMNNEASPAGRHMMGRVFRHFAKLGGKARMAKMTPQERRAHQRMAALAKAKADRKSRRAREKERLRSVRRRAAAAEARTT
jgi:hypothetical protein